MEECSEAQTTCACVPRARSHAVLVAPRARAVARDLKKKNAREKNPHFPPFHIRLVKKVERKINLLSPFVHVWCSTSSSRGYPPAPPPPPRRRERAHITKTRRSRTVSSAATACIPSVKSAIAAVECLILPIFVVFFEASTLCGCACACVKSRCRRVAVGAM